MKLGVVVKLLTQQSAAASATAVEINENELVLAPGLGHGLLKSTFEPILGRSCENEDEEERKGDSFFHICFSILL
jgi:hypothetical protein